MLSLTDFMGWRFGWAAKTYVVLLCLFNMSIGEHSSISCLFWLKQESAALVQGDGGECCTSSFLQLAWRHAWCQGTRTDCDPLQRLLSMLADGQQSALVAGSATDVANRPACALTAWCALCPPIRVAACLAEYTTIGTLFGTYLGTRSWIINIIVGEWRQGLVLQAAQRVGMEQVGVGVYSTCCPASLMPSLTVLCPAALRTGATTMIYTAYGGLFISILTDQVQGASCGEGGLCLASKAAVRRCWGRGCAGPAR